MLLGVAGEHCSNRVSMPGLLHDVICQSWYPAIAIHNAVFPFNLQACCTTWVMAPSATFLRA
jgi:hypothetical protein